MSTIVLMASQPFLSVIIPSYNEMDNLQRGVLEEVYSFLKKQNYEWELVLSDDGSSDGTVAELQEFTRTHQGVSLLQNQHAGKAPTVSSGMLAARGKFRLFTDFDQSTPIAQVNNALALIETGFDIVIGSREVIGSRREKEPIHRHVMGRVFNLTVQILALHGVQDSQCGFKLFSENAVKSLFPAMIVYGSTHERKDSFTGAFDVELLFLARKWNFRVKEMGVPWVHNESDRVNPMKDSLRMLRDILLIRVNWLLGKYEKMKGER